LVPGAPGRPGDRRRPLRRNGGVCRREYRRWTPAGYRTCPIAGLSGKRRSTSRRWAHVAVVTSALRRWQRGLCSIISRRSTRRVPRVGSAGSPGRAPRSRWRGCRN